MVQGTLLQGGTSRGPSPQALAVPLLATTARSLLLTISFGLPAGWPWLQWPSPRHAGPWWFSAHSAPARSGRPHPLSKPLPTGICCTILGRDFNPTRFVNVHVNIFVNVVDLHGKSITVVQQPGLDMFEPQQEPKCCIPLLKESGKAWKSWPSEVCSARNIAPRLQRAGPAKYASWRQWHSWRRSDHTNHPGEW